MDSEGSLQLQMRHSYLSVKRRVCYFTSVFIKDLPQEKCQVLFLKILLFTAQMFVFFNFLLSCRETTFPLTITGAWAQAKGQGPLPFSRSWPRSPEESFSISSQEAFEVRKHCLSTVDLFSLPSVFLECYWVLCKRNVLMLYYVSSLNVHKTEVRTVNYTVAVSLESVHRLSERRLCLRLFEVRFTTSFFFCSQNLLTKIMSNEYRL